MKGAGETEADTPRPGLCHTTEVRRLRSDGGVVDRLFSMDHFLFGAHWREDAEMRLSVCDGSDRV